MTGAAPEAVLFDLDGVLIESREAWYRVMDDAARHFGHPDIPREAFDETFGQSLEADIERFYPGTDAAELDAFLARHFLDHAAQVVVNGEAQPVFQALSVRGTATAIVTNTQSALARETVRAVGLTPDLVLGSGDVARDKPAPDMVELACERLDVAPERARMVGDSRYDREAARAAGVRFVGYGIDGDDRIERLTELLRL